MALSSQMIPYGIHSICPYNLSTGLPYGILKVLGGGTLTLSSEFEELFGGSNKFAWAVESKTISTEWVATVKSMPDFLFELFLGASVSSTAASATGTVDGLEDKVGTLVDATGIASVEAVGSEEAKLKVGKYMIVAVSATSVDVYALTDVDFKKDAASIMEYVDDSLKITASPLTITMGGAVAIPNMGVTITGGAGTIGMDVGDAAMFDVAGPHGGIDTITIGQASTVFPEHGQVAVSQKRANGDLIEIEMFKVQGSGFPIGLEEQAFSIQELSMKLIYDSCNDKVAEIRSIKGVAGC